MFTATGGDTGHTPTKGDMGWVHMRGACCPWRNVQYELCAPGEDGMDGSDGFGCASSGVALDVRKQCRKPRFVSVAARLLQVLDYFRALLI